MAIQSAASAMNGSHRQSHAAVNGNNAPPPSTLAAQLADQQSIGATSSSKALFGELLREIKNSQIESDPETNLKLVSIVADAGLDIGPRSGFRSGSANAVNDNGADLGSQLHTCIDIIDTITRQTPEILLMTEDASDQPTALLCFLLLSRAISLLVHGNFRSRAIKLFDLFQTAMSSKQGHWLETSRLFRITEHVLEHILNALEAWQDEALTDDFSHQFPLPAASMLSLLSTSATDAPLALSRHKARLHSLDHALMTSASLLLALSESELSDVEHNMSIIKLASDCSSAIASWKAGRDNAEDLFFSLCLMMKACGRIALIDNVPDTLRAHAISTLLSVAERYAGYSEACTDRLNADRLLKALTVIVYGSRCLNLEKSKVSERLMHLLNNCVSNMSGHSVEEPLMQDLLLLKAAANPDSSIEIPNSHSATRAWLEQAGTGTIGSGIKLISATRMVDTESGIKRRRTPRPESEGSLESLIRSLCSLFVNWNTSDLASLQYSAADLFADFTFEMQLEALDLLGRVQCSSMPDFKDARPNEPGAFACGNCQRDRRPQDYCDTLMKEKLDNLADVLATIMTSDTVIQSKPLRVSGLLAIQRFACHSSSRKDTDLKTSALGQICLQGIKSSMRELRMICSRTLTMFLKADVDIDGELAQQNRSTALKFLHDIKSDDERMLETVIESFGHAYIVCEEDGAHLILYELLEYLGHTNPYISGQAYLELRRLAGHFSMSMLDLLRPHWNELAVPTVKDVLSRPQKAQQVAELLGISVKQLLVQTQKHTIPYLLCNDQLDIVRRIADAKEPPASLYDMCIEPSNLACIVAYLALHYRGQLETALGSFFVKLEPALTSREVEMLAKSDAIGSAKELLKAIANGPEADWSNDVQSFRELAGLVERRGHALRTSTTQSRMTISFFGNFALGIMASFSDSIDSPSSSLPEKRRNLLAIGCMIEVARQENNEPAEMRHVIPVPQIRACLQSAFDTSSLCNDALGVWLRLISVVDKDEVQSLIMETFTLVVRRWTSFNAKSQQMAYNAIAELLKTYNHVITEAIDIIPSLSSIPIMSKFQVQLANLKNRLEVGQRLAAFARRCNDENMVAVQQTLHELLPFLQEHEQWIHETTASESPSPAVADLIKALLDICARFQGQEFLNLAAQGLGIIGCVDVNRVEVTREQNHMIMLSNFNAANEAIDFATYILQHVLVKAFRSVTNPRAQGFLAYAMQELLRFCEFSHLSGLSSRSQAGHGNDERTRRWYAIPEVVRGTLTPFLSSRYVLSTNAPNGAALSSSPLFSIDKSHGQWLTDITLQLLGNAKGENAAMVFKVLARVIRGYDISIASLLLPFAAANIIIDGSIAEGEAIGRELLAVLQQPTMHLNQAQTENIKHCSHNVFEVLDYLSRWLQDKRRLVMSNRLTAERNQRALNESDEKADDERIAKVDSFLKSIPSQVISSRAQECGSYTRALLHWEYHLRETPPAEGSQGMPGSMQQLQHLQDLYTKIDDPDGIEGVGAFIFFNNPMQQILEHQRAGRWDAAKTWYELELGEKPQDVHLHGRYLDCLLQGSDYSTILKHASSAEIDVAAHPGLMSAVSQASWSTGRWKLFEELSSRMTDATTSRFNTGVSAALVSLNKGHEGEYHSIVQNLRSQITRQLSNTANATVQASHDLLLQLHALTEADDLVCISGQPYSDEVKANFTKRLEIMGSAVADKQYILGLRRAVMQITHPADKSSLAASWIKTAKLARKSLPSSLAYEAVYHAAALDDETANVEHAKLLWSAGEHRRALQGLLVALQNNKFVDVSAPNPSLGTSLLDGAALPTPQNLLLAKAQLTYAKWLDHAGQSSSETILHRYRTATYSFQRWELGFYHLGRFYNKLLESERALPLSKQSYRYLGGEMAKLVVDNYLRSMTFGSRNLAQSLPRMLTLWLEFGEASTKPLSREIPEEVRARANEERPKKMSAINSQVKKYFEKIVPFVFYTALAQMLTRITHPNASVWSLLSAVIVKVAASFPQQSLWSILASVKATDPKRKERGGDIVGRIRDRTARTVRNEGQSIDLRDMIVRGQVLTTELVRLCDVTLDGRSAHVSLSHTLGFKTRTAPCPLVVPYEKMLTASLPTGQTEFAAMRAHRAFPASREAVTISGFEDDVLVLSSLQRPRKLTIRGSDGRPYGIMCKPHDDLRKDQRLMEFNGMINRALKKDSESALRRLQIGTYAVTPLNETNGVLEWVEGLKPMRDILISLYKSKGIKVDYNLLRDLLNEACSNPPETTAVFTDTILSQYKPVLHEWFTEHFPSPDAWYAARTRYARSCAASSMVGHALGLGDRHGENVLLVERDGSVFHVDFNCLFDKGLTFEKPELVPFRLTHNMVDAMGSTGVEGYFRRAAECTMRMMREQEDVLLTNLETFVYDPTTDYVGRRHRQTRGVPGNPKEVLESVRSKVQGLMLGESLRLSVQGHVEALIKQARDPDNLAAMYIGWCSFL